MAAREEEPISVIAPTIFGMLAAIASLLIAIVFFGLSVAVVAVLANLLAICVSLSFAAPLTGLGVKDQGHNRQTLTRFRLSVSSTLTEYITTGAIVVAGAFLAGHLQPIYFCRDDNSAIINCIDAVTRDDYLILFIIVCIAFAINRCATSAIKSAQPRAFSPYIFAFFTALLFSAFLYVFELPRIDQHTNANFISLNMVVILFVAGLLSVSNVNFSNVAYASRTGAISWLQSLLVIAIGILVAFAILVIIAAAGIAVITQSAIEHSFGDYLQWIINEIATRGEHKLIALSAITGFISIMVTIALLVCYRILKKRRR